MGAHGVEQSEALKFLDKFNAAYAEGNDHFFDAFRKDANIFALSVPDRISSVDEYRAGFGENFSGRRRSSEVVDPQVLPAGPDSALVTYYHRVKTDTVSANNRVTLLLTRDGNQLKISHLHASPVGSPTISGVSKLEHFAILEERVATALGTVGTPK